MGGSDQVIEVDGAFTQPHPPPFGRWLPPEKTSANDTPTLYQMVQGLILPTTSCILLRCHYNDYEVPIRKET
jgi:hypothetical protein